ncbi:MAG: biopolymer transporter ExbD [Oleiphilaceae bacterium]|nr:biopolymer transporter ExbD [Oleiphilaceae bacterium]
MQWLEPRPHRRLPIRLTPLIDVVFILLLFFMLTSRLTPMGLVQLDTASERSTSPSEQTEPARLHIGSGRRLLWQGEALDAEGVEQKLAQYRGDAVRLSTAESVPLSEFTLWLGKIRSQDLEPLWQRLDGERESP